MDESQCSTRVSFGCVLTPNYSHRTHAPFILGLLVNRNRQNNTDRWFRGRNEKMMCARFVHTNIDMPETSTEEDQVENDVNMLAFSPGAHKKTRKIECPSGTRIIIR